MAGVAAEIVVFGGYDSTGCKTDMEHAEMRLVALGYDDDGSAELWRWTLDLMREHEDVIVRLARELFHARWLWRRDRRSSGVVRAHRKPNQPRGGGGQ